MDFAKRANKAKPNDMSKMVIARSYRAQGKTDDCVSWVNKVLKAKPNDGMGLAIKAGAFEDAGRIDDAESTLLPLIESVDGEVSKLSIPILDVHYERLVADPESEFPRLIEFLELDFDPSCYDFHNSKRTVRTLSYDQVNRPLYTTSSGLHINYESHIKDIAFPAYHPTSS